MKPSEFFSHWKPVRQGLLEEIDSFGDKELAYRACPECWPAGQIMIHIANAEEGWFRYVIQKQLREWPAHLDFSNHPDKDAILKTLEEVHAKTELFLASITEEDLMRVIDIPWGESLSLQWIIWHVLEHEIHHRGELSLMLGMLGKEGLEV